MSELGDTAGRAVEAALAAGAGAAEAYAARESGREVRVHAAEVESLTAATQTGVGVRAWIGHRVGYAYGTDLTEAGVGAIAARAAEAARVADEDEFAAPPQPAPAEPLAGLSDPSVAASSAERVVALALEVERSALATDPRVAAVEQAVYADAAALVALASSAGVGGEYESSSCFAYLQALAEGEGGRETGLGFGLARGPDGLDPVAIGRRGRGAGGGDDRRRQARVALLPRGPRPDRGRQLRRPDRRRARRRRGAARALARSPAGSARRSRARPSSCTTTAATLTAPPRRRSTPRGVPRRRTALIEGGRLRAYLYDTYTANRDGVGLDRQRRARRLPLAALGLGLEPRPRPRGAERGRSSWPRPARASTSPTSPGCTRASTRSPASSPSAPRGGRSAAASWPSRCASSRSRASWSRCSAPSAPPARRRAGSPSGARSARRRC